MAGGGATAGPAWRRLAARLKDLRQSAGLDQAELAAAAGISHQTVVSKIERAERRVKPGELDAWAQAAGADAATLGELRELLLRAFGEAGEFESFRNAHDAAGGAAEWQAQLGDREANSHLVGKWVPGMVAGLVQTPDYAAEQLIGPGGPRAWIPDMDVDGLVARRMQRQEILYQSGREVVVLMGEAALRNRLTSAATMRGQLDRLLQLSGLSTVTIGVVPFDRPLPVLPLSTFSIYDDNVVAVEESAGQRAVAGSEEADLYAHWFKLLREAAVTGPDLAVLVQAALGALGE